MSDSPERSEVEASLKRICSHKLFVNSSVYSRLLEYLIDKHYENEDLKEYTIASELFARKQKSSDATVRTYMYHLRKRLEGYYADEGAKETFRFSIPKGQYNLSFEPIIESIKDQPLASPKTILVRWLAACSVVLAITVIGVVSMLKNPIPKCWSSFFEREANNILVVSDQVIVSATNQSGEVRHQIIRKVKNANDLIDHIKSHPDEQLEKTDYTLMTKMAPFSVKMLTEWFVTHKREFSILMESDLKFEDIKNNNVMFIGQRKTMDFSDSLFLKNSAKFEPVTDGYRVIDASGKSKSYKTIYSGQEQIEYAMVSHSSVVEGKTTLYFVSNHDIGVMALVRNFTDPKWLNEFQHTLPTDTKYFNALFEVKGIQRNDVSCKLIEFEQLEIQ